MSLDNLPVEWSVIDLESLSEFIIGGDWGKDTSLAEENYIEAFCIRGAEFKNWKTDKGKTAVPRKLKTSSLDTRRLKVGDILVEISGGGPDQPVGRTVYIEELVFKNLGSKDIVCTNFLRLFRPTSIINAKYLNFYLSFFYKTPAIVNYQSGSNNLRNLQFKDYLKLEIPIASLAEQKEIVRQLDVMLAQVEQIKARLDAIPALLKKFRQSVLADAVSGKLTEEWRDNKIDIASWTSGELREFIEKPIYGTSAKSSKEGDVPVLRMGNLQQGEIDWTDLVYTSDATEIEKYDLKLNDLLFNRTNSPELVGKTSIYRGDKEAIFAGYLIRIRCLATLDPEFLNYHLNSHIGRDYCYRVKTDGVSQSNINAQKVLAYPFNCPSIEEQKIIVKLVKEYLGLVDRIEATVKSAQKRVNLLTQSILAKAFSGELTAEWREQHQELITGVNSAESLLAKIQAEREASKPVKKTRAKKQA